MEEAFNDRPLQKFSELKQFLLGSDGVAKEGKKINIIGPSSSELLRAMVKDVKTCISVFKHVEKFPNSATNKYWPDLKNVKLYVYGELRPKVGDGMKG